MMIDLGDQWQQSLQIFHGSQMTKDQAMARALRNSNNSSFFLPPQHAASKWFSKLAPGMPECRHQCLCQGCQLATCAGDFCKDATWNCQKKRCRLQLESQTTSNLQFFFFFLWSVATRSNVTSKLTGSISEASWAG